MSFLQKALKSMGKGFEHAHNEDNLNFSVKSYTGAPTKASVEQVFTEPQLKNESRKSKRRYIAMYLGSDLPKSMMKYIIESCQHLGHDLAVISFEQNETTEEALAPYKQELETNNIEVKKVKLSGHPMQELNKYLKSHRDIAFLACKDTGFLGRSYMSGNLAKISLPVPLVVVTTEKQADSVTPIEESNKKNISQTKVA